MADPDLRALGDPEVHAWAGAAGRRVLTENVKDFLPLARDGGPGLLLTSSRTFPRSRRNPGPLLEALDAWLVAAAGRTLLQEEWLQPKRPVT